MKKNKAILIAILSIALTGCSNSSYAINTAPNNYKTNEIMASVDDVIQAISEVSSSQTILVEELVPQNLQYNFTQAITRAEFCALVAAVYEHMKGEIIGRTAFIDTDDINVQKVAYIGIVNGVGDNRFNPNGTLTREQAAVILSNLANVVGQPFCPWLMGLHPSVFITDYEDISYWAVEDVVRASWVLNFVKYEQFQQFQPQQYLTREESIIAIKRTFEFIDDIEIIECKSPDDITNYDIVKQVSDHFDH